MEKLAPSFLLLAYSSRSRGGLVLRFLVFVRSPLGVESFEAGSSAQIADIGLGVGQIGAILPEANSGHHGGSAFFDLGGIELLAFHDG